MKVVAILPVKGSSTRVENKNIKLLDGKPLFLHTLEKLASCDFIDEVYIDTESSEITALASECSCKVLMRDPALASNSTDGHSLFMNQVRQVDADIYIHILCTSPFIKKETIKQGVDLLRDAEEYDCSVLVRKEHLYLWDETGPVYRMNPVPNSNELDPTIIETMGLYIVRRETALQTGRRIGNRPHLLEATALEAVDVNWQEDFDLANLIAAGMREDKRKLLANLAQQLSSAMISDIMDDLSIKNKVIQGMELNLPKKKIFGRAKTLRLKAREESDMNSIYDALSTYDTIVPNDIILVETALPQYAYFGELNANLAMRSGAVAAIVGGNTRDSSEVERLDFPVFAKGYTCRDIKHNGTVAEFNKKICIEGVEVCYEDLIFADKDGIIVIPLEREDEILDLCKQVLSREKSILAAVSDGVAASDIRSRFGDF